MKNANLVSRLALVAIVFAAAGTVGCRRDSAHASRIAAAEPKTGADYFAIKVGDRLVQMQLAVLPGELQRGLMERRDLGRDQGMLFLYERPQKMSFWMRNTPTPLDIGFFDGSGVLQEVYPMHPFDERSIDSRGDQMRFALEMNQGWFRENNVTRGAALDFKALAAAVEARGFDPKRYGLE